MTIPLIIPTDDQGPVDLPLLRGGLQALDRVGNGKLIRVKGVADAPANRRGICARGRPCPR